MSTDPREPDRLEGAPHPRRTVTLRGQASAEARFLAAMDTGRPPHGWLITGPKGAGKATLAWHIARYLVAGGRGGALHMDETDPVFRRVAALGAPEVFLCRRPWDDKGQRLRTRITVDEVRALKAFFQLSAAEGGWRVAIVDSADEMNEAAANALLKILEEPPPRAALLLVCDQPTRLLPTLRSRCRELRCAPLGSDDLAAALSDAGADPGAVAPAALAALAAGSVGAAFRLIELEGVALYDDIAALLSRAPGLDARRAIALADSCAGREAEARYGLVLDLLTLALSRLALAAAGTGPAAVSQAEAALWSRLGTRPAQARSWATHVAAMSARTAHARAVHLDPALVILDTCQRIDTAAAEVLAQAA